MLRVRYVCKVYCPMVRKEAVYVAVASTPFRAFVSVQRGLAKRNWRGKRKVPSHMRKGMTFRIDEVVHEQCQGAFSKPPLELPANLTRVHTLA